MKLIILKSIAAMLMAWILFIGDLMLLRTFDILDGSGRLLEFLTAFVLIVSSFFLISWVNCQSIKQAIVGTLAAAFIGIPTAYTVLGKAADAIMDMIAPYTFSASGSFSSIWFLLSTIVMIEMVTDNALRRDRRLGLLIGILAAISISVGIETYMMRFGRTFELDMFKEAMYAPIIWGTIVTAVNFHLQQPSGTIDHISQRITSSTRGMSMARK